MQQAIAWLDRLAVWHLSIPQQYIQLSTVSLHRTESSILASIAFLACVLSRDMNRQHTAKMSSEAQQQFS
jgi:hypothetical protein